jgi:lipoprotein-anchoring transpeptidase ErfK/SrfK
LAIANNPRCANSISCIDELEATVENNQTAVFLGEEIAVPTIDLQGEALSLKTSNQQKVLGETDAEGETEQNAEKHIYVDLSQQTLYAYDGDQPYFETLVSTGKWGRTPTGEFSIWIKIRSTKMSGGSGNDYYYLPNVPYVMYFYNNQTAKARGFGLHGTYWHNNFGHEMSHGCINLRTIDAKTLYQWATPVTEATTTYATQDNPGTKLTICNQLEIREGQKPVCLE